MDDSTLKERLLTRQLLENKANYMLLDVNIEYNEAPETYAVTRNGAIVYTTYNEEAIEAFLKGMFFGVNLS